MFFDSSLGFKRRSTELYDFMNGVRSSVAWLTSQLEPALCSEPDDARIMARFSPSDDITGQNLRKFGMLGPEERESELAAVWLFSIVALFELWVSNFEPLSNGQQSCLEWPPEGYTPESNKRGIDLIVVEAAKRPSASMVECYAHKWRNSRDFRSGQDLYDSLLLYRAYKSIRNAVAHSGRLADRYTVRVVESARERARRLHTDRMGELQPFPTVEVGQRVGLTIPQVQFATALIRSIVYSVDTMFALSEAGESLLFERYIDKFGSNRHEVSRDVAKRRAFIRGRLAHLGWHGAANSNTMDGLFVSRGLMFWQP